MFFCAFRLDFILSQNSLIMTLDLVTTLGVTDNAYAEEQKKGPAI